MNPLMRTLQVLRLEDGSMSSQAQQSIEDGSVPSAEVDDVDTSNVDKDAPVDGTVWLSPTRRVNGYGTNQWRA